MGRFLRHTNCIKDSCGSSDALAIYEEDDKLNGYCFSCGSSFNDQQLKGTTTLVANNKNTRVPTEAIENNTLFADIPHRGISKEVAEFYGVRVSLNTQNGEVDKTYIPLYVKDKLMGYKTKDRNKEFSGVRGVKSPDLFGKAAFGKPRKMIVITEGEEDAMCARQMFLSLKKDYVVVSLPTGANKNGLQSSLDWIEGHQHIVLCFDQDDPGKKITEEAIALFTPGKVKIMTFSEKDANDMLLAGKAKEFLNSLFQATIARPDGIVSSGDTWERIKNRPKVSSIPYPDGWDKINSMAYGMRIGELDTWTSGSGMGKTQVIRILEKHLLDTTDDSIGIIALEEPLEDSIEALMALELKKRISLPDVKEKITDEEMYDAWQKTAGANRVHLYDHFGSVDDDSLVIKIRYMAKALNCKYIFLDHLSIVVSEFASEGGERERIDTIMTKLKNLTQELDVWLGLVVHLRKNVGGGKSFEEGGVPNLDDLRGSGSIKQLSNNVYALSRNQQAGDDTLRNTSRLHVLKCRFTGRTGPADFLYFEDNTGWMVPVEDPEKEEEGEDDGGKRPKF